MNDINKVHGRVKAIYPMETLTSAAGNQFTKQCILLDAAEKNMQTGEVYPNDLKLEFCNFKGGDLAERLAVGNEISVAFSLKGFSYTSKKTGRTEYGIGVRCFSIITSFEDTPQSAEPAQTAQQAPQQADGLPF